MTKKANGIGVALAVAAILTPLFLANTAEAGLRFSLAYSSDPADIRVWLERSGEYYDYEGDYYDTDVYESVDDVALYVRASRSCYATVYVVDTEGYIHIVHPLSPAASGYLRGGRVYKIYLSEMGFDVSFGAGIAYAYAVCGPAPFDYSRYGAGVFGARCGYRIYGDPYVAARLFYVDLVAGRCAYGLIRVSHARFYVGTYVRYPKYLCVGWHDYYGVRTYCRGGCTVYRHYAIHARSPYRVLHPERELRPHVAKYTHVTSAEPRRPGVRVKGTSQSDFPQRTARRAVKDRGEVLRPLAREKKTVVKSSNDTFERGKKDLAELRRRLDRRDSQAHKKHGRDKRATKQSTKVHKAVAVGGSTKRGGGTKSSSSSDSRGVKSSTKQKKAGTSASSKARGK